MTDSLDLRLGSVSRGGTKEGKVFSTSLSTDKEGAQKDKIKTRSKEVE